MKSGEIYISTPNGEIGEGSKYMTNKQPTHKFGDSVVKRHQNQVCLLLITINIKFLNN